MNERLNGVVYRGNAVYYTFQRAATGASYLRRLENRGKNLKDFHVTYSADGKEQKKSPAQFLAIAGKMGSTKNGAVKAKAAKPAKKSVSKPKAKKPAKVAEPVSET